MEKTKLQEASEYLLKLREHALRRLPDMLDRKRMLFSFRSTITPRGWVNEGFSTRYTAIALLGLLEAKRAGCELSIDIEPIIKQLHLECNSISNLGDLGLVLWMLAKSVEHGFDHKKAEDVLSHTVAFLKEDREQPSRKVDSMEFSWMLLALLECQAKGLDAAGFNSALENACLDLTENLHQQSSLFSFNRIEQRGLPPRSKRLSFFAEQIYGIFALSTFYALRGGKNILEMAEACADKLVGFQSSRGGWPWRYHAEKGTMAETFPLYSVHQDGMAPMALAKLSLYSSRNYLPHIAKGILWIRGENEIDTPMFDEELDILWRSVLRRGPFKILSEMNKTLSLIRIANLRIPERIAPFYEVKPEVRSYHLGWILCACAALEELRKKLAVATCKLSSNEKQAF